jgi:acyl-CoA thioester hydrolase
MRELKKTLESKMKIRFHDCDPFNHLNNSRYIDYIVTARGDQLIDNYNLDIYKLAREKKIGWVTAQTQISYIVPAYLMEEVIIQTQLLHYTEKSLLLEAFMWSADKTVLKAVMWAKLVHFNLLTQKSHSHSEELMQLFSEVTNPPPIVTDFETRIKDLRSQN